MLNCSCPAAPVCLNFCVHLQLIGYTPNRDLHLELASQNGSQEFNNARAAMASPLANKLFGIDGVTKVFFGSDFITVTKTDAVSWAVLKPDIFASVMDFFASGEPIVHSTEALSSSDTAIHEDDDEVGECL